MNIIKPIFKTRLAFKIWYYTIIIMMSTLLLVSLVFYSYFNFYTLSNQKKEAAINTAYVAKNYSLEYHTILRQFIKNTVNSTSKYFLHQLLTNPSKDYIHLDNSMQNIIGDYSTSSQLIHTAILIKVGKNKEDLSFYHSYYVRLNNQSKTWDLGLGLDNLTGVTTLPSNGQILINQPEVTPIAIPLTLNPLDSFITISQDIDEANFVLYLLLNTKLTSEFLSKYCDDNVEGSLYLTDGQGVFLNVPQIKENQSEPLNPSIKKLDDLPLKEPFDYLYYGDTHYFVEKVPDTDFFLVNAVNNQMFSRTYDDFRYVLTWIAFMGFVIITCLCLIVSSIITRPLKKLMTSVDSIKSNTYKDIADIKSKDEIGQLNQAIHTMHKTIQDQILIIKDEEESKYQAQIQVLAEQINPHFLYNALEFINMEILNNHNEIASDMISNLGVYLRMSLAYGDGMLTIAQELDQTRIYLNIMNHRYSNNIHLTSQIDPDLRQAKIIKSILQPFVENSIKHGFNLIIDYQRYASPSIHISFNQYEDKIILTITDNGSGFDPEKVKETMLSDSSDKGDRHIGLHNVYQRLCAYYKNIDVDLKSIPFVMNSIIITINKDDFIHRPRT